jgi:DNA-binding CsgD family transcriptional regulator
MERARPGRDARSSCTASRVARSDADRADGVIPMDVDNEMTGARRGARPGQRRQRAWKRDPEILARLQRVERMRLDGWSNLRIAAALDVAEGTIRNDVRRLEDLWLESLCDNQERLRAARVAELTELYRRAIASADFDQLCERAVLFGGEVDLEGVKKLVLRNADGEATFKGNKVGALNVARQAVMDIAKIMGLIVDKVAPTDGKGNDLTLADLAARAREARAEREARELPATH